MKYVANIRIRKGGKLYAAGDPITLSDDDLKGLPEGAVSPVGNPPQDEPPQPLDGTQIDKLKAEVVKLKPEAFKQDGEIRAGDLRDLIEVLGFAVTVADVTAAQGGGE